MKLTLSLVFYFLCLSLGAQAGVVSIFNRATTAKTVVIDGESIPLAVGADLEGIEADAVNGTTIIDKGGVVVIRDSDHVFFESSGRGEWLGIKRNVLLLFLVGLVVFKIFRVELTV